MNKILLILFLLFPLFYLLLKLFYFDDVADPIKYIYTITGFSSLILLLITTSLSLIKKYLNLIKYRKIVGLSGFFYAFLHFLNFIILDMQVDFDSILKESFEKPFIFLGMSSFLLLLFMAFTSSSALFKKYHKYHKVIYLVLVLTTIHFIMAQKSLSILEIFFVGIILLIGFFKLLQQIININNLN
ncbi:ferric reductase-like transmembrane domain-containing protein [Halarcobacter ebronensis]|uniref:Ferric reductase n=1 Tax=Halarcobacter ebronensis TaxID=1462615 RepID=A0A4Q1AEE2_9BACT|nr:ferric reductase-like transmembrane domain-containing protein [Halarcobacter ebronensis]QKF81245.1 periplasmic DMSO/TMAO reductase YedYZ, heme-binding membrane subunit [Halarcobacter ebronensis]RXK01807.1 ferric reductase [Halarcobacter ebronensis]